MSRRRGHRGSDDSGMGCVVILILALLAMPLVGLYLVLSKNTDDEAKAIGWIMLIAGCILWIYVAVKSA